MNTQEDVMHGWKTKNKSFSESMLWGNDGTNTYLLPESVEK